MFPKTLSLRKDQRFYLFGFITTLAIFHLNVVENHPTDDSMLLDYVIFWVSILILLWRTSQLQVYNSDFVSSLSGLLLLILVFIRSPHLWDLDTALFLVTPFVAAIGLGLIIFGWRELVRQWRFGLFLCLIGLPIYDFTFDRLFPFSNLTTAISAFLLHYIGFQATYQTNLLTLPTGEVFVAYPCTGGPLILYLLKVCLMIGFIFPLSWLQKLGLALSAISTGFIVGCFRVALLATVVHKPKVFEYWHSGPGIQIFLAAAIVAFVAICNWVIPTQESTSREKDSNQLGTKIQRWRIPLLASTWIGMGFAAICLVCIPTTNIRGASAYAFPNTLNLKGWQQVSESVINVPTRVLDHDKLLALGGKQSSGKQYSGKQYTYNQNNQQLSIQMRYMVDTHGNLERFLKELANMTTVQDIQKNIRYLNNIGYYALINDNHQAYLTACINPRGNSTVTEAQFIQNSYRYDLTWNRILPWILGSEILKDNRCMWVQLSTPLNEGDSSSAYKLLESVWATNYATWQSQFPKP